MFDLYNILIEDEQFDLINILKHVESKTPGFNTIIVPKNGFSSNPYVHSLIIIWLQLHNTNIIDTNLIINNLITALADDRPL